MLVATIANVQKVLNVTGQAIHSRLSKLFANQHARCALKQTYLCTYCKRYISIGTETSDNATYKSRDAKDI